MINIRRFQEAPPCLERRTNYKCGDTIDRLEADFLGKCYLCETDQFSINVEHHTPHKNNPDLKFKWKNLFFACDHCNSLKSEDIILDCTDPGIDVEERISYRSIFFPEHEVFIKPKKYDNKTKQTAKLLSKIFNGTSTIRTIGASKLRRFLVEEMIHFQGLMLEYEKHKHNPLKSEEVETKIAAELHASSKLTAFKRQIIKDNEKYFKKFGKYLKAYEVKMD